MTKGLEERVEELETTLKAKRDGWHSIAEAFQVFRDHSFKEFKESLHQKLEDIFAQVKKTNGRVTKLELNEARLQGIREAKELQKANNPFVTYGIPTITFVLGVVISIGTIINYLQ